MKTESHSINNVLAINATSFFIPPFQRAYAWGRPEIERYFSDVKRIINSELKKDEIDKLEHFFGTLVIKKEEKGGFPNLSVIVDGQQRLTTTLIFLIALRDLETDEEKIKKITRTYLTNEDSSFPFKIKLKQVTKDWEAYRALVKKEKIIPGIISNAYNIFYKLISDYRKEKPEISLENYITAIQRMNVAVIFLDERPHKGEDPQIIFETLNSLGKPLSLSDLVRNFVLLNMKSENQTEIYEKTWHPKIEEVLNDNTSNFFRDYLQYKTNSSIKVVSDNNTKEVYQIFKKFVEDEFKNDRNAFVVDIISYVPWYYWIITEEVKSTISTKITNNSQIIELVRNIFHDINAEAFKPFVLGLFEYNQKPNHNVKLSDDILIQTLQTIRTYLIRKRILGLTQGENKNIVTLCNRIKDIAIGKITMFDLLSNMFYRMRMPNDIEVRTKLMTLNFYEELKKYSKFILGKIEEYNTKVSVDFRDPKITIEHIMPQKPNESWNKELGDKNQEIHKKYLHNIGNLILTEFNSEIGNKSFAEKKQKLNKSSLYYRLSVTKKNIWNEESIVEHQNNMINWFLKAFNLPDNYKEKENWNTKINEGSTFSPIDNDASENAEGNKPIELKILNTKIVVNTWKDVFIQFLYFINVNKKNEFDFILDNQTELFNRENVIIKWSSLQILIDKNIDISAKYNNFDGKVWHKVKNITGDELFIHTNFSASACMIRISNIMNKLNMDADYVKITLK